MLVIHLKPQVLQFSNGAAICFHALENCLLGLSVFLQNEKIRLV